MKTNPGLYDIIPDIHGHAEPLKALLSKLGYKHSDGCYRHPTRTAIFLGDFIDRGPAIREVLHIVRAMCDQGQALAVMGNHELNALAFVTPDGRGGFLRPHTPGKVAQHAATLAQFWFHQGEWRDWLRWFETLPLFLDLGGLRIVHACWDDRAIAALAGSHRYDASLLPPPSGTELSERQKAIEMLLKGPEVGTPGGKVYDGDRTEMRVKWWVNDRVRTYASAGLQVPNEFLVPEPIPDDETICRYPTDAAPVFFGHYGYEKPAGPLTPNVACLDLGVTRGGGLCAYRWDGEREIDAGKFVTTAPKVTPP